MLNHKSLTASMLRRGGAVIDDATNTAKSHSSVPNINLTGKTLSLPSGKVVTVVEDTGRDTYLCMYDVPEVPNMNAMTKDQLHEARKIEFKKSFLIKYGEEFSWKQQS